MCSQKLTRRSMLQVGYSSTLGLGMASLLESRKAAAASKAAQESGKSVLIIFLTGAASHHETFDMKPDAPAEVRGEFNVTQTSVPGLHVSEPLPKLAAMAEKYAVIRSFTHKDNNHLMYFSVDLRHSPR